MTGFSADAAELAKEAPSKGNPMVSEPDTTPEATEPLIAFKPDTLRRVGVTAAVLAIYSLLTYVPAPGLAPDAIDQLTSTIGGGVAISRFSIVALGLIPILSALIAGEFLKLAAPPLYRLEENPRRALIFNRAVMILGLLFAAFQAYGITVALEDLGSNGVPLVEDPGTSFRLSYIITLMAGVALTYWLAELITRHGIGSGFWVILLTGELWALPSAVKNLVTSHEIGQNSTEALLALTIVMTAAVFSIVALYRLRFTSTGTASPEGRLDPRDIMLPPLLGTSIASMLMMVVPLGQFLTGGESTPAYSFNPANPVWLILCTAMILLIAYLRAVTRHLNERASAQAIRWALITGAITAAIIVALEILSAGTGLYLISGTWLTILIVVCLVFLSAQLATSRPDQAGVDAAP